MSVTDTAVHRGACENCNATLGKHDAVFLWYVRRDGDVPGGAGYHPRRGCLECFEEAFNADFKDQPFGLRAAMRSLRGEEPHARSGYCERCARTVVVVTLTKYPGEDYDRVVYCSRACRDWTPPRGNFCKVCGRLFGGKRRDAKTCSPACRQKAYRRRETGRMLNAD